MLFTVNKPSNRLLENHKSGDPATKTDIAKETVPGQSFCYQFGLLCRPIFCPQLSG